MQEHAVVPLRLRVSIERDNEPGSVVKAEDGTDIAGVRVLKADGTKRITIGVAYPAMRPDRTVALDGHRDFMSAAEVEKSAHAWMARSRKVGLLHAAGTDGHGQVVESSIHRGPDWVVKAADGSDQVVREGDWLMAVKWDVPGWELVEKRVLNGFSPQGAGLRRGPSPEQLAALHD